MKKLRKKMQIIIEKTYVKILGLQHIPNSECNLLYCDIKTYKGKPITINDITIQKGDLVAELHIDNLNIHTIDGSSKSIVNNFRSEMLSLYKATLEEDSYRSLKGAYAVSVLHPMLRLLGFTAFPLTNKLYSAYLGFWENMLRTTFSTEKKKKATKGKKKKKREPMTCWITPETIKLQAEKAGRKI